MESCVQLQPPSLLNSQNSSSKLRFYSCTTKDWKDFDLG
uniref:Uncharacterized protein n=1 Tax=Vitis vinifera TaxID=29760 RepID=F6HJ74_VITVI